MRTDVKERQRLVRKVSDYSELDFTREDIVDLILAEKQQSYDEGVEFGQETHDCAEAMREGMGRA